MKKQIKIYAYVKQVLLSCKTLDQIAVCREWARRLYLQGQINEFQLEAILSNFNNPIFK